MFGFGKKSKYAALLSDIDYVESSKNIAAMCLALMEDAKSKGCVYITKKDKLHAQELFVTNPCFDTAVKLLEVDPGAVRLFIKVGDTAITQDGWSFIVKGQNIQPADSPQS